MNTYIIYTECHGGATPREGGGFDLANLRCSEERVVGFKAARQRASELRQTFKFGVVYLRGPVSKKHPHGRRLRWMSRIPA